MAVPRRTTDVGTVIIHAALVLSFLIVVGTGLRIATDNPTTEWLIALDPILPTENLWYRHLLSGLVFMCAFAAHAIYVRQARLRSRTRLDRARILTMLRRGPQRWAAINTLMFKVLLWSSVVEIMTGCIMFLAPNGALLAIHLATTFVVITAVVGHVALHAAHGGLAQLLRIVRPARLEIAPPPPDLAELLAEQLAKQAPPQQEMTAAAPFVTATAAEPELAGTADGADGEALGSAVDASRVVKLRAHPLATALTVAMIVAFLGLGAEHRSREMLSIREIDVAMRPTLDGDLSDPAWARATPVSVLTTHGGDFGGTHQSRVEIRAVHDGTYAYFAFVWEDPTRSLRHQPLVKRAGRWHIAASSGQLANEEHYNEDKFSVLLTRPGRPLIGGAIHLAHKPLSNRPPSATGRGLHYTPDGSIADIWLWRASHGGVVGHIDNCHFGGPAPVDEVPDDGMQSYAGGFAVDPGPPAYQWNVNLSDAAGVLPRRLPRDLAQMAAALGRISNDPGESDSKDARWWMTEAETVPYTPERDADIPDGTIIPSIIVPDDLEMTTASIRGVARWAAGRWSLEVMRRLYTGSAYDVPIKSGTMLWVAAFDHAEKRHTRHLRPFILEVD
ncbi:MAG: ethylbenzene dehydrogenase-related protein [Hyphomicrobiaceae bacterium]